VPAANAGFMVATICVDVLLKIVSLWLFSITESEPVKPLPPIVTWLPNTVVLLIVAAKAGSLRTIAPQIIKTADNIIFCTRVSP
jgi:hypothetical protein